MRLCLSRNGGVGGPGSGSAVAAREGGRVAHERDQSSAIGAAAGVGGATGGSARREGRYNKTERSSSSAGARNWRGWCSAQARQTDGSSATRRLGAWSLHYHGLATVPAGSVRRRGSSLNFFFSLSCSW
jgi:hypothetical protein